MITKNIYEMPYPSAIPSDMDGVKAYIDILASWLAEKLGLVVRSDLAVTSPDYAPNSYVTFIAKDAESDPYLTIYNANITNVNQFKTILICPTKKTDNYFRPINVLGNVSSTPSYPMRTGSNIIISIDGLGAAYKVNLVVVDFNDGRKIGCFRSTRIATGAIEGQDYSSSIYFGKIRMQGHDVNTCVLFGEGVNSSWLEDYDQCASATEVSYVPCVITGYGNGGLGIIFNVNLGKEFILDFDYCIGADAYVPNIIQYSDCQNAITNGSVLTINNKKYVCLYRRSSQSVKLLMPEIINE